MRRPNGASPTMEPIATSHKPGNRRRCGRRVRDRSPENSTSIDADGDLFDMAGDLLDMLAENDAKAQRGFTHHGTDRNVSLTGSDDDDY
ncbi:hypothetical protein GW17_00047863 [Ensete ventricosum]|nr:hypothetical protein GW17_00047863 [Ensete ventricosum]